MPSNPAPAPRAGDAVARWADAVGLAPRERPPDPSALDALFPDACRPPASPEAIADWEHRHQFMLPAGLKDWLAISDGFFLAGGTLVHPLQAIGPMIPFARVEGMHVPPESWFELGNPQSEAICIDLGYRWPKGDHPVFTSGDDNLGVLPKIIAAGFVPWFARVLRDGGREYWSGPEPGVLGDPWTEHRRRAPLPGLSERLLRSAGRAKSLLRRGADDREIASALGLEPGEVEAIVRHLQHRVATRRSP
jgi:hypothetical protein